MASSHANANANNAKVAADAVTTVANPSTRDPIGIVRLGVKNVVDLTRLQFLSSPSARIGMTLSDNNNGVHICTARDASSQGFIRHCPPAISYAV